MATNKPVLILLLVLALAMGGGLTACGQKGDLYLPGKPDRLQPERP